MNYSTTADTETIAKFKLIEGTFSAAEARSIIMNFYSTKILFHNHQLLAMNEGSNGDKKGIEHKIEELEKTRKSIAELLSMDYKDKIVEVRGFIEIEFKE